MNISNRISYPQNNFTTYKQRLSIEKGLSINEVTIGWAGSATLHFMRSFLKPIMSQDASLWSEYYDRVTPIHNLLNYQPDHKLWDLRPLEVIAKALWLPKIKDGYGNTIQINEATAPTKKNMVLTNGYIATQDKESQDFYSDLAKEFETKTDKRLTDVNY
jgi:hypothetical protein